jgi:phospholipid/cholesterol/gamma-HCH transport system ATP-binding protein
MDRSSMIEVKNLTARYDDKVILENINFTIYPGEIFMIIGGSGSGKTTLLEHLIGLQATPIGEIIIDGQNICVATDREKLVLLKKIGVLYQSGALFGSMTLLENVAFPLEELTDLPDEAVLKIAQNKLKMVGLEDFYDYMPAEISGGMKKRAAIARAMALDPKVLFLDEPSSGLDPISASEIDQLVVNLSEVLGITFVIVCHNISSICRIAQRVILLHNRRIAAEGAPLELKQSSDEFVKKFFASGLVR